MSEMLISQIAVPADHPSLPGHFAGNPIVPGVVLLDAVLAAIQAQRPCALQSIPGVKFLQPVRADERIDLHIEFGEATTGTLRAKFKALRGATPVCDGTLVLSAEAEATA